MHRKKNVKKGVTKDEEDHQTKTTATTKRGKDPEQSKCRLTVP